MLCWIHYSVFCPTLLKRTCGRKEIFNKTSRGLIKQGGLFTTFLISYVPLNSNGKQGASQRSQFKTSSQAKLSCSDLCSVYWHTAMPWSIFFSPPVQQEIPLVPSSDSYLSPPLSSPLFLHHLLCNILTDLVQPEQPLFWLIKDQGVKSINNHQLY